MWIIKWGNNSKNQKTENEDICRMEGMNVEFFGKKYFTHLPCSMLFFVPLVPSAKRNPKQLDADE
jgi:hypothetical protein